MYFEQGFGFAESKICDESVNNRAEPNSSGSSQVHACVVDHMDVTRKPRSSCQLVGRGTWQLHHNIAPSHHFLHLIQSF